MHLAMKVNKVDKLESMIALKDGSLLIDVDHPNVIRLDEQFY